MKIIPIIAGLLVLLYGTVLNATLYSYPGYDSQLMGQVYVVKPVAGQTFSQIARAHNMGYDDLRAANPRVNPNRLRTSQNIIIPAQFLLPSVPAQGIIINLAERRIYYFPAGRNTVFTSPIGVGRQDWRSPIKRTKISEKRVNPKWYVPKSIRIYSARKGKPLPKIMGAGPDNPLGKYAMRIGTTNFLIHGTNQPRGIGRRVSSGCIRLYPESIKQLFHMVPIGTPVRIINEPYKVGWHEGALYLEVNKKDNSLNSLLQKIEQQYDVAINYGTVKKAQRQRSGIPIKISR